MKYTLKIILLSILCLHGIEGFAQNNSDYNWMLNHSRIDFSGDTVKVIDESSALSVYKSNATFSDINGQFLGYSNGCYIANKYDEIIEEGDSLNYNDFVLYENVCIDPGSGYTNGNQGMMPITFGDSIVLIHEKINIRLEDALVFTQEMVLTSIKIDSNAIYVGIKEHPVILDDSLGTGHLSAVKHRNNIDWWIIKHDLLSNCYYSILFNGESFTTENYECIGLDNTRRGDGGGGAVFSPNGEKYARFSPEDALFLFDFNRETGQLSNFEFIDIPKEGIFGGISFSPSGQFLYVCDRLQIRQYDVWSEDVAGSEEIVAVYDGFIGNNIGQGTTFGQMRLAPDCRIYLRTGPALPYMHVIMRPNEKGMACDVRQHNIDLPNVALLGLPNFPNYRLGTTQPLCDSTKVVVLNGTISPPVATIELDVEVKIFPNPASSYLNLLFQENTEYEVSFHDIQGSIVLRKNMIGTEGIMDVRDLIPGIYFLHVIDIEQGRSIVEKVVIQR